MDVSREQFWQLVTLGRKLRELHLLTATELEHCTVTFPNSGSNTIEKIFFKEEKIFINETQYFADVHKAAFDFYIGGYQPAQKWLKDRKRQILTPEDIEHYKKIVTSITLTIQTMSEIDAVLVT